MASDAKLNVSVLIPKSLVADLDAMAKEDDRNRSNIIVRTLSAAAAEWRKSKTTEAQPA